jgi:hypothetical protein
MSSIVKKLNAEKVPAFGDRVPDENGGHRKAEGARYGCGQWRTSYVRQILSDKRALGQYQPRDAQEQTKGDPIPDYYPRVVSDADFYAARAAVASRKVVGQNRQGRIGDGVASLFGGLLRHARDGQTYYAATRSDAYGKYKVLLNKTSIEGQGRAYTFPYATFERAVLSCLREIDPRTVINPTPPAAEVSVLQGELNWLRERKAALALELLKGEVSAIADAIRQVEAREAELASQLEDNAETTAVPRADSWRTMHTLIGLLDDAPDEEREDLRLRLRAVIRRSIETAWLLVVPRGRDRLCAVQLHFADSGRVRNHLILSKSGWANAAGRTEGGWKVWSLAIAAPAAADIDLRQLEHAARLAEALQQLDMEALGAAE